MSADLSLFDHVQEGVVVADAGLVVRHWNSVIARWSGIDPSDAVGRPLIALAPKLEDDRYRRPVEAVIARGSPVTFSAAIHHYIIPCPGKEPGEFRQQDTVVCPLPVDGATMALFSVVDRTDHIANLRGLQQANVKLRRTVRLRRESDRINMMLAAGMDNAAEAILVVDHRGRLEYANPMFYRLAQLEIPSVKGQLLTEILRTDQGEQLHREVMRAISSGEPWRGRVVVIRPDESRFPASISAAPVRLRKGRRILHAVLTMEDITDYELANHDLQERKKHEAMRTMVAGISHDFNNLLSGMVGNAYLLRKAVREDPKAMRRLATLEEALEEATAIIQGLVVYARGEEDGSGVLPLFPFVKEWCKEVRSQLPEGVELRLQLQPGHYPMRGDVALLKQVLTAVADNAVDALAGCERPRIAVSFGPEEESAVPEPLRGRGRVARLDVADSGCGIPGRLMERIWQPFFTTKPQGNGLGLTVARENMARLGGVMTVDSTEGEGTTVSLWLPLAG